MNLYLFTSRSHRMLLEPEETWPFAIESVTSGKRLGSAWKPYELVNHRKVKLLDFPLNQLTPAPLFSAKAWAVFEPYIGRYCEALPVYCEDSAYYFINFLVHTESIVPSKSDISYNHGTTSSIRKYFFDHTKLQDMIIFKDRLHLLMTFYNDEFLEIVQRNKLTGLYFAKPIFQY